jgi:hypothetical protein
MFSFSDRKPQNFIFFKFVKILLIVKRIFFYETLSKGKNLAKA